MHRGDASVALLTIHEVADLLRVSASTVRRAIADGRLSALRVGRSIRVRQEAVGEFIVWAGRTRRPRPLTLDDPIFQLMGSANSGPDSPGDESENVDKYLAEAYLNTHE